MLASRRHGLVAATLLAWVAASVVSGCGARHRSEAPAHARDFVEALPPGATFVVLGHADRLRSEPATARVVDAVFDDALRAAVGRRLGIEPGVVERFAFVAYEPGYLVIVEGRTLDARSDVRSLGAGMNTVELETDVPYVRRVGFRGAERMEAVALADRVVALGGENGGPMVELLARWSGRRAGPSLLGTDDGRALLATHGEAPLAVLAPTPLDLPVEQGGLALLLARHRALGGSLRADGADRLRLVVTVLGELPPGADANLGTFVRDLALSDLGDLFGMRAALPTLTTHADAGSGRVELSLSADALAQGLRDVLVADLRTIGASEPPSR